MTQTTTTITIDRDLLQRMAADIVALPALLSAELIDDELLRGELQLPFEFHIRLGELPAMDRNHLYEVVRKAFHGQPQTATALDGSRIQVEFRDDQIHLASDARQYPQIPQLMFLHPDPALRLSAFDKLNQSSAYLHPLDRDWRAQLQQQALANEDLCRYLHAAAQSVPATLCELLRNGAANPVPDSFDYYCNLAAPIIDYYDEPEFISDILQVWFRKVLALDAVTGLASLLPTGMYQCTRIRPVLVDWDNDRLWTSLEAVGDICDPASLLNILDLCLARADDRRFAKRAELTLERLLADVMPCGSQDAWVAFPHLLSHVYTRLRQIPKMAEQPEYWIRLCAFAHSGQLLNQKFAAPEQDQEPLQHLARQLELISIPGLFRTRPDTLHMPVFVAEQVRRLLATHEEAHRNRIDADRRLQSRLQQLAEQGHGPVTACLDPFDMDIACGQVQGEVTPPEQGLLAALGNDAQQDDMAALQQLRRLSLAGPLPGELLVDIAAAPVQWPAATPEVLDCLRLLAELATMNRSSALGEKVLRHSTRLCKQPLDMAQLQELFDIALMACGYHDKLPDALDRLNRFLRPLAEDLAERSQIHWLGDTIANIKRLTSVNFWVFSDTEAILRLAD